MATNVSEDRPLTRDEAAAYLGVNSQTLAVWALTGRYGLKFQKVGRRVVYRKSELDRFLQSRTITATGQLPAECEA